MITEEAFIVLHGHEWLEHQRIAGKAASTALKAAKKLIEDKTSNLSLKDIEQECLRIIQESNCTPTFLNYKGFPGAVCASVNKQLVHGIPSTYKLKEGDVVKIDLGATYQGAIADCATTAIYGEPIKKEHLEVISTCRKALDNAISSISVGKRLGSIGAAIHHTVKSTRFKLITNYGGHGISKNKPHSSPFVSNRASSFEGVRFQPGMTLAIEPMVVVGDNRTRVMSDGWTVVTDDVGAHFEKTIFIHQDKVEIITEH